MKWSMKEFDYTPSQRRLFRAVAGAVMNCANGHPEWNISKVMARSIAKRAAGTLVSLWPVLAAGLPPSEKAEPGGQSPTARPASPVLSGGGDAKGGSGCGMPEQPSRGAGRERRLGPAKRRPNPFKVAHVAVGMLAGEARRKGDIKRHAALVDALHVLAKVRRADAEIA